MSDKSALIMNAADYKISVDVPNALTGNFNLYVFGTIQEIGYDIEVEDETIYAVGTVTPIAEESNAKSYKGKLTAEAGEINAILGLTGKNDATSVQGATLGIIGIKGGFARVFTGVNFNTESLNIKAKDKHTPITINWKGLSVNND